MRNLHALLGLVTALSLLALPKASAQPGPADLPVVPARAACAGLTEVNFTVIGGAGSRVTGALETTSDGIPVCSVTGTLAPQITFQVLLPTQSWTQRYLQVGCGGLCGTVTLRSGGLGRLPGAE